MERKKISLEIQWAVGPKTGVGWYILTITFPFIFLIL